MTELTKTFLEQKAQNLNNIGITAEFYIDTEEDWEGQLILKWYKDGLVHYVEWDPESETGLYFEGIEGKPISPEHLSGIENGSLYYRYTDTHNGPMKREYFASIPDGYYEDRYSSLDIQEVKDK